MSDIKNSAHTIRTALLKDAQAVLEIQQEVMSERNYLMTLPEEFHQSLEEQTNWIEKILANERETILVAEIDCEIVGWIAFLSNKRKKLAHVGSFTIMIKKGFRERGIGKMLLKHLLDWQLKTLLLKK